MRVGQPRNRDNRSICVCIATVLLAAHFAVAPGCAVRSHGKISETRRSAARGDDATVAQVPTPGQPFPWPIPIPPQPGDPDDPDDDEEEEPPHPINHACVAPQPSVACNDGPERCLLSERALVHQVDIPEDCMGLRDMVGATSENLADVYARSKWIGNLSPEDHRTIVGPDAPAPGPRLVFMVAGDQLVVDGYCNPPSSGQVVSTGVLTTCTGDAVAENAEVSVWAADVTQGEATPTG